MEIKCRNITLAFIIAIYSFSVFGSNVITSSVSKEIKSSSDKATHFTALSKVLFPQTVHADGNGISIITAEVADENELDKVFLSTQTLCQLTYQYSVNYFKEAPFFNLQFSAVDIIFPFHNFW